MDILSWKSARYTKDIAERTRSDLSDVEYIIQLFSMIMPIDWDQDKKYFMDGFENLYPTMEKILYGAQNTYEDNIILPEGLSTFLIKPDPLADFLHINALKNPKLKNVLWKLVQYIPLRITYNILTTVALLINLE